MKKIAGMLCMTLLGFAAPAPPATEDDEHTTHHDAAAASTHSGHGKVNSVDSTTGKVNITHNPIKSLKWPKMTMDFTVHDPALLKDIRPGMEVDFELTKMSDGYRIMTITPAKEGLIRRERSAMFTRTGYEP